MNKILLVITVLALATGGYFLLISNNKAIPNTSIDSPAKNDMETASLIDEPVAEKLMPNEIINSPETKTGKLDDVSGGSSFGTAYVLRENNMLYHYVDASLPDPNGSNVYEGWLVKKSPQLLFFSTGIMEKGNDGNYVLTFMSDDLSDGYDFVVITEETIVDKTPEKHIIEGLVE